MHNESENVDSCDRIRNCVIINAYWCRFNKSRDDIFINWKNFSNEKLLNIYNIILYFH